MSRAIIKQEELSLETYEAKLVKYPDILRSGYLGPCIAIGFYDKVSKGGYMIHDSLDWETTLDETLAHIKDVFGNFSNLRVYATGGSLESSDSVEQKNYENSRREFVERTLKKYFANNQLTVNWMPENRISELFLDTKSGKFLVKKKFLDEIIGENND